MVQLQSTTMEDGNTGGKFGIPRFDGNPHQLLEYVYRFQTRIARGKAMTEEGVKKLGPLGLRLVAGLRGQVDWSVFGKRQRRCWKPSTTT